MAALLQMLYFKQAVREIHLKILHKMYPTNMLLSKCMDIGKECSFCNSCEESLCHMFGDCQSVQSFWKDCFSDFSVKINLMITNKLFVTLIMMIKIFTILLILSS